MTYLETEEEASERIADFYDSRDDTRKKEEKHIDTPYLKSKKNSLEKINEESEESEKSKESEEIKYEKIDMKAIDYLYKNMNELSFKFVTVDRNKYKIDKVLDFFKNIKNGRYDDNNIKGFYYFYYFILFAPINSLKEENTDETRSFKARFFCLN